MKNNTEKENKRNVLTGLQHEGGFLLRRAGDRKGSAPDRRILSSARGDKAHMVYLAPFFTARCSKRWSALPASNTGRVESARAMEMNNSFAVSVP